MGCAIYGQRQETRDKWTTNKKTGVVGPGQKQQLGNSTSIRNECLPIHYLQCKEISLWMQARCLRPSHIQCFYLACYLLSNYDDLTVLSIHLLQLFWAFLVGCDLHPTTICTNRSWLLPILRGLPRRQNHPSRKELCMASFQATFTEQQRSVSRFCQQNSSVSERTGFQGGSQMLKMSPINCLCIYCFILTDNESKIGCLNTQIGGGDRLEGPLLLAPISWWNTSWELRNRSTRDTV